MNEPAAAERRTVKLARLRLSQFACHEDLELDLDTITLIRGANRSGKTSILRGIRAALGGGHDATLIRQGADGAEAVLVLDDETEIRKRIRPTGSQVDVNPRPEGVGPQTYLNVLHDAFGLNALDVLSDAKRRREAVLAAAALVVTAEQLREALGDAGGWDLQGKVRELAQGEYRGTTALEVLDRFRREVYDERTVTNRDVKRAEARVDDLRRSLPADAPAETAEQLNVLLAALDEEERELREQLAKIAAERGSLKERLARIDTDANTRRMLQDERERSNQLQKDSEAATRAIARFDALRTAVAANLPFGLSFDEAGGLLCEGIPWESLNTEHQVSLAFSLAAMRPGRVPGVLVDGIQELDDEHRRALYAFAQERIEAGEPLQMIVTQVSDGPLTVQGWNPGDGLAADLFEAPAAPRGTDGD